MLGIRRRREQYFLEREIEREIVCVRKSERERERECEKDIGVFARSPAPFYGSTCPGRGANAETRAAIFLSFVAAWTKRQSVSTR